MNFKESESDQKLRGGYYTPPDIAVFLSDWVLEKEPSNILEPSCGDGAFINGLSTNVQNHIEFTGVELDPVEAQKSRKLLSKIDNIDGNIINRDFLDYAVEKISENIVFDAILGNPPYIRYQYLSSEDQRLSEEIFKLNGLKFTKHTNAWVPFVLSCIDLLKPKGRLAMVLPSELLHVLHATSLRDYLVKTCHKILLVDPTELLFEEALQGTVLLMAEKKPILEAPCLGVAVTKMASLRDMSIGAQHFFSKGQYVSGAALEGKWMRVLLNPEELAALQKLENSSDAKPLKEIASVDVGIVTGANKFFLVDEDTVKKNDLKNFAHPMFGRSEHCPGVVYDHHVHKLNTDRGAPSNFLLFNDEPISSYPVKAQEYLSNGMALGLHTRYKCRIRKPWYVVPSVYSTELGMLKRSHHFPKLIFNSAKAFTTDTAYRLKIIDGCSSPKELVSSFVNSITALSAELEGRHYGGGVLELVPSEIEKLLIPANLSFGASLTRVNIEIIEKGDKANFLLEQSMHIFSNAILTKDEIELLHNAWLRLKARRQRKH